MAAHIRAHPDEYVHYLDEVRVPIIMFSLLKTLKDIQLCRYRGVLCHDLARFLTCIPAWEPPIPVHPPVVQFKWEGGMCSSSAATGGCARQSGGAGLRAPAEPRGGDCRPQSSTCHHLCLLFCTCTCYQPVACHPTHRRCGHPKRITCRDEPCIRGDVAHVCAFQDDADIEAYCKELEGSAAWGGQLELSALAQVGCPLCLYNTVGGVEIGAFQGLMQGGRVQVGGWRMSGMWVLNVRRGAHVCAVLAVHSATGVTLLTPQQPCRWVIVQCAGATVCFAGHSSRTAACDGPRVTSVLVPPAPLQVLQRQIKVYAVGLPPVTLGEDLPGPALQVRDVWCGVRLARRPV